jgi:hypothetical protein
MRGGPGSTRSYSSGLTRIPSAGSIVHALHLGQNLLPSLMGTSLNQVRVVLVMDAGRTTPLVKVQAPSGCVTLFKYLLLPNPLGHALIPLHLCPVSKRHLIMLQKSRMFWAQHVH